MLLEEYLKQHYQLAREMRFPYGNRYGWGLKYSHRKAHLCDAFFEAGTFTITLQLGDRQLPLLEEVMSRLTPQAQELWQRRYPCGKNGGWIHYRVLKNEDLADIYKFLFAKKKPPTRK